MTSSNSEKERTIFYVGDESDFSQDINNYFSKVDNELFTYKLVVLMPNEVIHKLSFMIPDCIIWDFSTNEIISEADLKNINIIKNIKILSGVPIVGLYKSKKTMFQGVSSFTLGINYAYIKGNDFGQFMNNVYYITYEDESYSPLYAIAKGFECHAEVEALMFITHIDNHCIYVDTDISLGDEIETTFNFFEDMGNAVMPVEEVFKSGAVCHTFNHAIFRIPFASGWEEDDNAIFEDTFISWQTTLENEDELRPVHLNVVFYSKKMNSHEHISKLQTTDMVRLTHRYEYNQDDNELFKFNPGLIIYQITDEQSYDEFEHLMCTVADMRGLKSVVLLFGHNSASDALRKVYGYPSIISSDQNLEDADFDKILSLMERKAQSPFGKQLKLSDERSVCRTALDVGITSITENEITFKTRHELAMYTILELKIPIHVFVIVIPPFRKLSPNIHGYHYMAILLGMSLEDSRYIRSYVNRLIHEPPTAWQYLDLKKSELDLVEKENKLVSKEAIAQQDMVQAADHEREQEFEEISETTKPRRRKSAKMKSKL